MSVFTLTFLIFVSVIIVGAVTTLFPVLCLKFKFPNSFQKRRVKQNKN